LAARIIFLPEGLEVRCQHRGAEVQADAYREKSCAPAGDSAILAEPDLSQLSAQSEMTENAAIGAGTVEVPAIEVPAIDTVPVEVPAMEASTVITSAMAIVASLVKIRVIPTPIAWLIADGSLKRISAQRYAHSHGRSYQSNYELTHLLYTM
jgi:hypothetical protein